MNRRIDKISQWLLRPDDAADLFGSAQVVQDFRDAGWLTPIVERKRVTLFDVVDLARCRKLLKKHGDLKLQELAKNGRAVVQRLVCKSESALLSVEKSFFWDFIRIEA